MKNSCVTLVMCLLALVCSIAAIAGMFIFANNVLLQFFEGIGSYHSAMVGVTHIIAGKFLASIFFQFSGLKDKK